MLAAKIINYWQTEGEKSLFKHLIKHLKHLHKGQYDLQMFLKILAITKEKIVPVVTIDRIKKGLVQCLQTLVNLFYRV